MRSRSPSAELPSSGTRYPAPSEVLRALERTFDEPNLDRIAVIYRPLYVRCHLALIGGRCGSVTRPGHIYTNLTARVFFQLDRHVLHEYYHVVQQWGRERMTRIGYLLSAATREREARLFVVGHLDVYRRYLCEAELT